MVKVIRTGKFIVRSPEGKRIFQTIRHKLASNACERLCECTGERYSVEEKNTRFAVVDAETGKLVMRFRKEVTANTLAERLNA